jgi:uncharacterized protein (DUF2336 family)
VGLTALDWSDTSRLVALAANPQGVSRGEIYLAVASLYRTQQRQLSERERTIMRDILRKLTHEVEMAVRISLAERLAGDPDAPQDLIYLLADDRIEVARPVILRSRLLTDADLLKFIASASEAHHAAIAERPNIGEPVTETLAKSNAESVLVALVRNVTAHIAKHTFETLVEKSKAIASIQEPLAHRGDLPPVLATKMCEWVSEALKTHIVANYKVSPVAVGRAVDQAVDDVEFKSSERQPENAQKLIDKLAGAGQLRTGFLLRVLNQGQMDLFDLAFARLLSMTPVAMREALYKSSPKTVAIACRAVGIDRAVFATLFSLSRSAHGMPSAVSREEQAEVEAVFKAYNKAEAIARLHQQFGATLPA